ncbi:MAG TPA: hypothetical protein VFV33_02575 [Gemmatimonadaceae bacterium]|nr:hypothetical protein [Gemmatimonadaceae bacterium]
MTQTTTRAAWGRWLRALALVALGGAVGARPVPAQERGGDAQAAPASRTPELLLQPGMLSADFVSAPDGYPATSGFNLRFATLVPTSSAWWTLIVGASVTPYGTSGITPRSTNTPVLFIGNVFPGIAARRTGGWLDVQFPVYLTYAYGGGGARNSQIYGRDLVAEVAVQLHVGRKVLRDLGPGFSRLRLYAMANQLLTPNEDPTSGTTDRFNPVALYGVTIPIGGREGRR